MTEISSYELHKIKTEQDLKLEIVSMYNLIAESLSDLWGFMGNKIVTFEEYIQFTKPVVQQDLSEDNYLGHLIRCAWNYWQYPENVEPDVSTVLLNCLQELKDNYEEWESTIIFSVADALCLFEIKDDLLVLPEKWFSPILYKQLCEFLKTFDCEKTKYKSRKAFKNNSEFSNEQILNIGKRLNGVSLSSKFNFFPTPSNISETVQQMANITKDDLILEPSAGTGNLLVGLNKNNIDCIEPNKILCSILEEKGYNVYNTDFESFNTQKQYDKIIMNPPFNKRLDAKHITMAFNKFLKPGGTLVAIHSSGINCSTDKISKCFQQIKQIYGVKTIELNEQQFKDSGRGTNINTCITKLVKI